MGRPTEAIDLAKRAIRITPVYPTYYPAIRARVYYLCDLSIEAITVAKKP
jgi:hypothetical protein